MDSLDLDNTVLNSIAFEDYDVKTDNTFDKPTNNYFKHIGKSSGIDSLSSFETVDTTGLSPNHDLLSKNKRHIESTPVSQEKRLKTDDASFAQNKQHNGILQNTLDCVNVSKTVCRNNNADIPEFDAFANYLHNSFSPKSGICMQLLQKEKCCAFQENEENNLMDSTQFISTQAIDEIESTIESKTTNCNSVTSDETSKLPLLLSFRERLKFKECVKETSIDKEIGERSVLFENEEITTQYRQEVDNLFEQIEHSIYAMGIENAEQSVSDKILDIIFSDDLKEHQDSNHENTETAMQWPEESGLTGSNFNLSFSSVIRKALINNASKTHPRKAFDSTLNLTFSEKVEFHNLGPFYGMPAKVKDLIKQYKGIDNLYDWQEECLKLPAIENKKNLIYALPTSGGKTLVAEILMFREVMCYKRNALLILPYVSIVQEKVWALSPFGVALDFLVEEYASSKGIYPPRKRRRKNCVYVATIEKALGIVNSLIETGRMSEIGLIVVDELHLIGEEGRGATLEATLTKIIYIKANTQIIGMSATIGNLPDICKFLDADVYTKNFRPVELTEYVKVDNEIAKINWNYSKEEELLIDNKKINYKYSKSILKMDPDMIGGLVTDVIPNSSCLVFCATKKNCENVASLLCKLCKPSLKNYKKSEKEQLLHALKDECGELCNILELSVQYGIAYHHSGLTNDERRIIEEGFRAGIIYVICCTSTLAAGVNLPARRVILRSPYIGREFINLSRYKQMVGRAGRAGLDEAGDSILIVQPQDLPKVKEFLMSPMNRAHSNMHLFDGKGLRHLLLSCISLGIANTRIQLQKVTQHTLLAVQSNKLEVNIKILTDKVIKNLFKLGALKESCGIQKTESSNTICDISVKMDTSVVDTTVGEVVTRTPTKQKKTVVLTNDTKLIVSELGCAAIKGGLELSRAHLLYEDLHQAQSCLVLQGHLHLLYLVTPYETAEQIRPNMQVYYEMFTHLKPNELKVAKTLGLTESVAVKMLSNNPIKNVPERVINRFYVTLMIYDLWNEMPVFKVSEKYQVSFNFFVEVQSSISNELMESIEFMSRRTANQIVAASKMLLLERVENLREEAEDVLDGVENPNQFFNQTVMR
nr:helicase POLQ-like [Leptinotarsa decemlineata]